MKIWSGWVTKPQRLWLRRALFQVHLWSGIGLGLYAVVVTLSGSAAVFNHELYTAFDPPPRMVPIIGARMTRAELKAAAQMVYPRAKISRISIPVDPHYAATVSLGSGDNPDQRFFDPYTGTDIGKARPFGLRMVSFFSRLHMNLLMGYSGRLINGIAGLMVTALVLTGMLIWWPGIERWRDSLTIRWNTNPKRFNWGLHSALGFWTCAMILMWTVTGADLVYPRLFDRVIAALSGRAIDSWHVSHAIHVGEFGGWPVKVVWVILGLAPSALFVTGSIMWWHDVLAPFIRSRIRGRIRKRVTLAVPQPLFEADRVGPALDQ